MSNNKLSSVTVSTDLKRVIESFDRRIYQVEQFATSPGLIIGSNEFDTIIVGGETISGSAPNPVTGVTATPDTFFDSIFVDIEWTPGIGGEPANTFDIEFSLGFSGGSLIDIFSTAGTNLRINGLQGNTQYSIRVTPVSRIGVRGTPSSWVNFTSGLDTGIPPAPTGVVLARGATTVIVKYTPLTAAQAPDVANGNGIYEIEIDTSNLFNTGNLKTMRTDAQIVSFSDIFSELTWYGRVRAIDMVGNAGPWSAVSAAMSGGGILDSMILSGLDAAKITVGFLSASRIQAGTLTADKLTTSDLTTANITLSGGSFKAGNPPTAAGLLINSQGLHLYDASGVRKGFLDSATGNIDVTGIITASKFLAVSGPELVANGGFEVNTTGWFAVQGTPPPASPTTTTIARDNTWSEIGTWSLKITCPTDSGIGCGAKSAKIPVDIRYAHGIFLNARAPDYPTGGTTQWDLVAHWYNAGGGFLSTTLLDTWIEEDDVEREMGNYVFPVEFATQVEIAIQRVANAGQDRFLFIDNVSMTTAPTLDGGIVRQSASGQRIEMVRAGRIDFYNGKYNYELEPARIAMMLPEYPESSRLDITSGKLTGGGGIASISLYPERPGHPTEPDSRCHIFAQDFKVVSDDIFLYKSGVGQTPNLWVGGYKMTPTDWVYVSGGVGFQNSWVNYGGEWQTARFRRIGQTVEIQGLVKNGTIPGVIFTLPVGYVSPVISDSIIFATAAGTGYGRLDIKDNGDVVAQEGNNGYFSISCSYSLAWSELP